ELAVSAGEALGHRAASGHVSGSPVSTWDFFPVSNHPAGAQLSMSAGGLAAFGRMHARDGLAANGNRVLSAESARAMRQARMPLPNGTSWQGLGWQMGSEPGLVFHGGGALGVSSFLCIAPESGVVIALAANGGDGSALVQQVFDPLLSELVGTVLPSPNPEPPPAHGLDDPDRYSGEYRLRNACAEVTVDESGRLWLATLATGEGASLSERCGVPVQPGPSVELRQRDGDVFAILNADGKVGGTAVFFGGDDRGRAGFLHHAGRAAPRAG
ncbi:MAG: serine hydrolase, partial [Stackebrandtia sp.]